MYPSSALTSDSLHSLCELKEIRSRSLSLDFYFHSIQLIKQPYMDFTKNYNHVWLSSCTLSDYSTDSTNFISKLSFALF